MSLLSTDQMPQHSPGFHHYKSYKYKSRRDLDSENLDPHEEILFVWFIRLFHGLYHILCGNLGLNL
jgi:hypothetical protein